MNLDRTTGKIENNTEKLSSLVNFVSKERLELTNLSSDIRDMIQETGKLIQEFQTRKLDLDAMQQSLDKIETILKNIQNLLDSSRILEMPHEELMNKFEEKLIQITNTMKNIMMEKYEVKIEFPEDVKSSVTRIRDALQYNGNQVGEMLAKLNSNLDEMNKVLSQSGVKGSRKNLLSKLKEKFNRKNKSI